MNTFIELISMEKRGRKLKERVESYIEALKKADQPENQAGEEGGVNYDI